MNKPILLRDNARLHVAQLTHTKLNQLIYETLPLAAYSLVLSHIEFYVLEHLDNFLRDKYLKR